MTDPYEFPGPVLIVYDGSATRAKRVVLSGGCLFIFDEDGNVAEVMSERSWYSVIVEGTKTGQELAHAKATGYGTINVG